MRWLAVILMLLAVPARASDQDAVRAVLAEAVAEWTVFFQCSEGRPDIRPSVELFWRREVEETLPWLEKAGLPQAETDAFAATLQEGHFAPPPDMTPETLSARCAAASGWERRLATLNVVMPLMRVRKLVNP